MTMSSLAVEDVRFPAVSLLESRIARRLRMRRQFLGKTLQDVAGAANLNFRQLHKYETAQTRVTAAVLWRLARVLSVELEFFFEERPAEIRPAARSSAIVARA